MNVVKLIQNCTLVLLCLSYQVEAKLVEHTFPLSTYILKSRLYDYTIELDAEPEVVELVFDKETNRFKTKPITLFARTDIPSGEDGIGFDYTLSLLRNSSQCESTVSGEITQTDIVSLMIGAQDFDIDTPVEGLSLDDVDDIGHLLGISTLHIIGNEMTDDSQVQRCQGDILIEAELTL